MQKQRLRVGEYSIDVRRSAHVKDRKTVLMLHGIGVSGTYFLPFAKILARSYNVHIIDMPGYGLTPKPDHALSPAELADIAAAYLAQSNIPQAAIVGQSMGCQIAARLATRYPHRCEKLLLIGPTVNKWERNIFMQALRLLQDTLLEPLGVNKLIFRDYLHMGAARYLATMKHMFDDHIEQYLEDTHIPVCIVRGTKDHIAPKNWTAFLATHITNAHVREVAKSPHNVQSVRPEELFATCKDFLEQ